MGDYRGLQVISRAKNRRNTQAVYFCCAPEDFSRLKDLSEEILHIASEVSVWYHEPGEDFRDAAAFREDLLSMRLFLLPVTENLLSGSCPEAEWELGLAQEQHIPILPISEHVGLEEAFNRRFGNLQLLCREPRDATELPFQDKLEKFVKSVIIREETYLKVKEAFDSYIFLSYRKKDRLYAQQIMHLIHERDFCRDIAIWYDEFLSPGEDFNDAISDALRGSSLFAMVVTPSLLEQNNYVMTTEYPAACREKKRILPLLAAETDPEMLRTSYPGLADVISSEETDSLTEALRDALAFAVTPARNDTPEHLFFIGLAYLAGINVETDKKKALELLEQAAAGDLPEAFEKLSEIYYHGDGTAVDFEKAAYWRRREVRHWESVLQQDPENEAVVPLFFARTSLGESLYQSGAWEEAAAELQGALELLSEEYKKGFSVPFNVIYMCHFLLCLIDTSWRGGSAPAVKRLAELTECFRLSCGSTSENVSGFDGYRKLSWYNLAIELLEESPDAGQLSRYLEQQEQALAEEKERVSELEWLRFAGKLKIGQAEDAVFRKDWEKLEKLIPEIGEELHDMPAENFPNMKYTGQLKLARLKRLFHASQSRWEEVLKDGADAEQLVKTHRKKANVYQMTYQESIGKKYDDFHLVNAWEDMAWARIQLDEPEAAEACYVQAEDLLRDMIKQTDFPNYHDKLTETLRYRGDLYVKLGRNRAAETCYENAAAEYEYLLDMDEKARSDVRDTEALRKGYGEVLNRAAVLWYDDEEDDGQSWDLYNRFAQDAEELFKLTRNAGYLKVVADIYEQIADRFDDAEEYRESAADIRRKLADIGIV